MKFKSKLLILATFAILFGACRKVTIEKEIKVNESNVSRQNLGYSSKITLQNDLDKRNSILEVGDTSMIMICDLNFDGLNDIELGFEIENLNKKDSLFVTSYLKKLNVDFQFIYEIKHEGNYILPFYSSGNYVAPNELLWNYFNVEDRFVLNKSKLEDCTVGGEKRLCVQRDFGNLVKPLNGNFDGNFYIGFRFKSKSEPSKWHYGYLTIASDARTSILVSEIAFEQTPDRPILIASSL